MNVVAWPVAKQRKYLVKGVTFKAKGKEAIHLCPGNSYTFSDVEKRVAVLGFGAYTDARKYVVCLCVFFAVFYAYMCVFACV